VQVPIKSRRPEDAELSRKREELAELQARLAELELQLFTLRLELTEFEALYHSKVGSLYAELDEVEALIAERLARDRPLDPRGIVRHATIQAQRVRQGVAPCDGGGGRSISRPAEIVGVPCRRHTGQSSRCRKTLASSLSPGASKSRTLG